MNRLITSVLALALLVSFAIGAVGDYNFYRLATPPAPMLTEPVTPIAGRALMYNGTNLYFEAVGQTVVDTEEELRAALLVGGIVAANGPALIDIPTYVELSVAGTRLIGINGGGIRMTGVGLAPGEYRDGIFATAENCEIGWLKITSTRPLGSAYDHFAIKLNSVEAPHDLHVHDCEISNVSTGISRPGSIFLSKAVRGVRIDRNFIHSFDHAGIHLFYRGECLYVERNIILGRMPTAKIGTTANGSAIVTALGSTTGLAINQKATGHGIPPYTTIASVDSATQVTLSQNATDSGTAPVKFHTATHRVADNCIYIAQEWDGVQVIGNECGWTDRMGIEVITRLRGAAIGHNYVHDTGESRYSGILNEAGFGISFAYCQGGSVFNNVIEDVVQYGIELPGRVSAGGLEETYAVTIVGNTIRRVANAGMPNTEATGIVVNTAPRVVISGNIIEDMIVGSGVTPMAVDVAASAGIHVVGSRNTKIANNIFRRAGARHVVFSTGSIDGTANDNDFYAVVGDGAAFAIQVQGTGTYVIKDNTAWITGAHTLAFESFSASTIYSGGSGDAPLVGAGVFAGTNITTAP